MAYQDRETTVVTTSSGGAGWFVAIVLLAVLAFGGFYIYNSGAFNNDSDINVSIDVPDEIVPAAPSN
jgi:hypothetical protein